MTEYGTTSALDAESALITGAPNEVPQLSASGNLVVQGLELRRNSSGVHHILKYVGEQNVPGDIKRLRRASSETVRRMGTPVLIKRMLTDRDARLGLASKSANFDSVYGQTRNMDPLSHGTGYTSKTFSENEYINSSGEIFKSEIDVSAQYVRAPKYRGYGPGFITYIIEPDVAMDYYKHTPEGVLVRIQQATAQTLWWPDIQDNDLIVHVELDNNNNIVDTFERYVTKMVNPVSLRGLDRKGRERGNHPDAIADGATLGADLGNRHVVNQQFSMSLLPWQHVLYGVEIDR